MNYHIMDENCRLTPKLVRFSFIKGAALFYAKRRTYFSGIINSLVKITFSVLLSGRSNRTIIISIETDFHLIQIVCVCNRSDCLLCWHEITLISN